MNNNVTATNQIAKDIEDIGRNDYGGEFGFRRYSTAIEWLR